MKEVVELEAVARRPDARIAHRKQQFRTAKRYGISRRADRPKPGASADSTCASGARNSASAPSSTAWTPAPRSSKASRRTSIRATNRECEAEPGDRKKVMILGSGPNRIGQGIEFDYCCCHASFALQEFGVESIMVNCNPGDRLDRLRHQRPPLLRAAHARRTC